MQASHDDTNESRFFKYKELFFTPHKDDPNNGALSSVTRFPQLADAKGTTLTSIYRGDTKSLREGTPTGKLINYLRRVRPSRSPWQGCLLSKCRVASCACPLIAKFKTFFALAIKYSTCNHMSVHSVITALACCKRPLLQVRGGKRA